MIREPIPVYYERLSMTVVGLIVCLSVILLTNRQTNKRHQKHDLSGHLDRARFVL